MAVNARVPSNVAATSGPHSCGAGTPYTGAATARRIADEAITATKPTTSCASGNDQRGNPARAKRRKTPRSRYDARWTGNITSPIAAITTVTYDATYQCDGLAPANAM